MYHCIIIGANYDNSIMSISRFIVNWVTTRKPLTHPALYISTHARTLYTHTHRQSFPPTSGAVAALHTRPVILQQSLGAETAWLADSHAGPGVRILAGQGTASATPVEGHATGTHRRGGLNRGYTKHRHIDHDI